MKEAAKIVFFCDTENNVTFLIVLHLYIHKIMLFLPQITKEDRNNEEIRN